MRYLFLLARRCYLTVACKFSAKMAERTKLSVAVALLDLSLRKHGEALGKEAVFCMNRTRLWQERAKRCVLSHHAFEKYLKSDIKDER